jgi:hypothetical protein
VISICNNSNILIIDYKLYRWFYWYKIKSILADLAVNSKFKDYFESAKKRKVFTYKEYNDAVRELKSEVNQKEQELTTLNARKRQSQMILISFCYNTL